jgi:hypothetical protein
MYYHVQNIQQDRQRTYNKIIRRVYKANVDMEKNSITHFCVRAIARAHLA